MSEQQKSVIIIGAGMSGLGTAAYSQMNGYQCTVFELHETPEGVAPLGNEKNTLLIGVSAG